MARVKKVGHVVLGVRDPQRSMKFYSEALGMRSVGFMEEMQMGFLAFGDERDHDIAVIKVPDDQPVGSSGLAHTALEIEGGEEGLRELYAKLKQQGIQAEFTADHVMTKSLYLLDPDGNRIELFTQVTSPLEGQQIIRDTTRAGTAAHELLKPLDLETPVSAG